METKINSQFSFASLNPLTFPSWWYTEGFYFFSNWAKYCLSKNKNTFVFALKIIAIAILGLLYIIFLPAILAMIVYQIF